ncbi:MAG: CGNR zinc finger domain-containing protein [Candidatus Dormibacteraeota bacterium]|nr:CGNR zinc finger domain-containing protein [Candidatus Dormibacteraeota bacterium]
MSDPKAPGRLGLVEELVNSVELPDGEDELATPATTARWLRAHGEHAAVVTEAERVRLVDLREALRDLLEVNGGAAVAPERIQVVTQMINAAGLNTVISAEGARLVPGGQGVQRFIGEIAVAMVAATTDGTWRRLKVCRNDQCRWAFFDNSKNSRRAWCSMQSCGCQSKSRAYRARKRQDLVMSVAE